MARYAPMGVSAVVDGYRDYINKVGKMADQTERSHSRISRLGAVGFQGLVKGAGIAAGAVVGIGTAATGAIAALGGLATKLALEGAPLVDFELGFNRLAEAAGKTGPEVLAQLQDVTEGTIRAADLMAVYNKGVTLLGEEFDNVIPIMGEVIKQGAALGLSPLQAVEDFTTGVARQSKLILDNLGIIVSLDDANTAYAESIGKTVDELTAQERQTALLRAASDQLLNVTGKLPDISELATAQIAQLKASFADTKDGIRKELVPVLQEALVALGPGLGKALTDVRKIFTSEFLPTIREVARFVGANLPKVIDLAVQGFRWFGRTLTRVWRFMETFVIPGFNYLYRIFVDNVIPAVETVIGFFGNLASTLLDAGPLSSEFGEALTSLVPQSVQDAVLWLITKVGEFYDVAKEWWETHAPEFKQAFIDVRDYIVNEFIPNALDFLATSFDPVIEAAGRLWETLLDDVPLVIEEWDKIKAKAVEVFEEVAPGTLEALQESWETLIEIITGDIDDLNTKWELHGDTIIETIGRIIRFGLDVLGRAIETIARLVAIVLNIIQGDWEEVERLITEGADRAVAHLSDLLGGTALGDLLGIPESTGTNNQPNLGGTPGGIMTEQSTLAPVISPSGGVPTNPTQDAYNFNLTVNTSAPVEPVVADFNMMAAQARRVGH